MLVTLGRSDEYMVNPARRYVRIAGSLPVITFKRISDAPSDFA